jgi:hypothetical protein
MDVASHLAVASSITRVSAYVRCRWDGGELGVWLRVWAF